MLRSHRFDDEADMDDNSVLEIVDLALPMGVAAWLIGLGHVAVQLHPGSSLSRDFVRMTSTPASALRQVPPPCAPH